MRLTNESVLWHLSRSSGLGLVGGFPNVTPGGMPVNGLYDKSKTDGHDGHHNHAISMNILNLKGTKLKEKDIYNSSAIYRILYIWCMYDSYIIYIWCMYVRMCVCMYVYIHMERKREKEREGERERERKELRNRQTTKKKQTNVCSHTPMITT